MDAATGQFAVQLDAILIAGLAGLGLVVGVLAGLFGIGGGFLLVPMLNVLLGVPYHLAVGSSLVQMALMTWVGAFTHVKQRNVDYKLALSLVAGSFLGVEAGVRLQSVLRGIGQFVRNGEVISGFDLTMAVLYVVLLNAIGWGMVIEGTRTHRRVFAAVRSVADGRDHAAATRDGAAGVESVSVGAVESTVKRVAVNVGPVGKVAVGSGAIAAVEAGDRAVSEGAAGERAAGEGADGERADGEGADGRVAAARDAGSLEPRETAISRVLASVNLRPLIAYSSNPARRFSFWVPSGLGFAVGVLTGLLGSGGGILILPVLIYVLGVPTAVAVGTSSMQTAMAAVYSGARHLMLGNVLWALVLPVLAGSLAGARAGALFSARLPKDRLRASFGWIVLATALIVVADIYRKLS